MSTPCVNGQVSKDFPLYHSKLIPIYISQNPVPLPHNFSQERMTYSNEHPDIFRYKLMKEGGYINPYLKHIVNCDREEYLKKIENSKNKIKLIDYIKSSRKFSQDPKYYNLIKNEDYIRRKKINNQLKNTENKYNSISLDDNNIINKVFFSLKQNSTKLGKNNIKKDLDFNHIKKFGHNFLINKKEVNKVNNLSCAFDAKKSSYLTNYNDYKISDAQKRDPEKELNYPRKPIMMFNPLNDKKQTFYPPPYIFPKWGAFPENYFILSNLKKGFNRKGGLFTELINKNIDKIKVLQEDIKRQLKENKENKRYRKINLDKTKGKDNSLTPSSSMKNLLLGKKYAEIFYDKINNNNFRNYSNFNSFKTLRHVSHF